MKPTLNEEIGMSQQGIDYVNSLEVKHKLVSQDIDAWRKEFRKEHYEKLRIRKQARNAWICIFVIIILTVILNWK